MSFTIFFDSGGIYAFPTNKSFLPRSPGTLIHMLSLNLVSLITSITSHMCSLTKNPTPPSPLLLIFCPLRILPIHV
ncbi:unnamed protein product [Ectocarpus sp. CCAP 1310/34]|nr:unnamed protein product [Ectocarpus sp. CCAP 1310/34]